MTEAPSPRQRTISTLVLAFGVGFGLVLCYLLAIPFMPALVGAFTLAVLFAPLDSHVRRIVRVNGIAAALTVAIVALIVVVPTVPRQHL